MNVIIYPGIELRLIHVNKSPTVGPVLLTWINLNVIKDKLSHAR